MTTSARCCPGAGKTLYRSNSGRNRWGWWSAYARLTAPTGGVGLPGRLIDGMALGQHLGILPSMSLCRCHQADPAVAMLVVVPLHEAGHPLAGVVDGSEPINGVARAVLAGAKQRLRVGVIIGDPRLTERWRDAQLMQLLQQWIKNERKRLSLTAHLRGDASQPRYRRARTTCLTSMAFPAAVEAAIRLPIMTPPSLRDRRGTVGKFS